jgi:hypothetical protein
VVNAVIATQCYPIDLIFQSALFFHSPIKNSMKLLEKVNMEDLKTLTLKNPLVYGSIAVLATWTLLRLKSVKIDFQILTDSTFNQSL